MRAIHSWLILPGSMQQTPHTQVLWRHSSRCALPVPLLGPHMLPYCCCAVAEHRLQGGRMRAVWRDTPGALPAPPKPIRKRPLIYM